MAKPLSLDLLGPLRLLREGTPVPLATVKAAALLVWLALAGSTPRARIAAALWPQQDSAAARRNLRRELARLRESGLGALVAVQGDRLLLDEAAVALDLRRFEAELEAGRDQSALALWRGPLADGLATAGLADIDEAVSAARARLARLRATALERSAADCEARGDIPAALAAVEALLADDPLQETQARAAMRLRAAAGQRAAAIAGYERFAALLSEQLGLTPMADTAAFALSLRQAPPPAAAPSMPPAAARPAASAGEARRSPAPLPFVGRDAELALLAEGWQRGRALVVEGPAGIGKTRLALEFAAARGAFALAACRIGDAQVPYSAFTRALRQLAGQPLPRAAEDAGWPAWLREALAHLVPGFGPTPRPIDSERERERFVEACVEAWSRLAAESFDVIVLDDWHLADAPSAALLAAIVRHRVAAGAGGARELLLLRPVAEAAGHAAALTLSRDGLALPLTLAPLTNPALEALLSHVAPQVPAPALAEQLRRDSGGNPLAVLEALRHGPALSRGPDTPPAGERGPPADDAVLQAVTLTVQQRAAALPDAARRVLEAAALAREPFTPALLAGACALSEVQALQAIEAALAADLLREADSGFAFSHELLRSVIESSIAPQRRRLVHRRLALGAQALAGELAVSPVEIAQHWELGGEPARAVPLRLRAARQAMDLFDWDAAEHQWACALGDGAALAQQVEIATQRGVLARTRQDPAAMAAALAELERLQDRCAAQRDTAASGLDAAIEAANLLTVQRRCDEALARIDAVLAVLPAAGEHEEPVAVQRRAMAMMVRSQALSGSARAAEGAAVAEAALALPGVPPPMQGRLLYALVFAYFQEARSAPALAAAERSVALYRGLGDRRMVLRSRANVALMLTQLGRFEAALAEFDAVIDLAASLRVTEMEVRAWMNSAYIELLHGRAAAALQRIDRAWCCGKASTESETPVHLLGMAVQAHAFAGELRRAFELAEVLHREALALGAHDARTDCVSMTLDLATDCGDFEQAERWLATLPEPACRPAYYRIKLAFNLAHLALARGDTTAAEAELAALGDVDALAQPADRSFAALRHAELCLARGDAGGALAWAARGAADAVAVEVQAGLAAVRLRAQPGVPDAAAQALLADPHVPAFSRLRLRLAAALPVDDDLAALADGLQGRPHQPALLLAHWGTPDLQRVRNAAA